MHIFRITNLGFGDPVPVFRDGAYAPQLVAGAEPRSPGSGVPNKVLGSL